MEQNGKKREKTVKNHRRIHPFWKVQRSVVISGLLCVAIVSLLIGILAQLPGLETQEVPAGEQPINYSAFLTQVTAGNVLAVSIEGNGINALLQEPASAGVNEQRPALSSAQRTAQIRAWTRFIGSLNTAGQNASSTGIDPERLVSTVLPANGTAQVMPLLLSQQVMVITQAETQGPDWPGLIWKFAPLLFLVLLLALVLAPRKPGRLPQNLHEQMAHFTQRRVRRGDGTASNGQEKKGAGPAGLGGKSSQLTHSAARPGGPAGGPAVKVSPPPTTFADVAGIDEVRVELEEIVQFLRTPEKFERLGARIPRGALLVGAPGTGKTLLARAVAGEAGVPFFSISASEFVEMFVGVGASRVRNVFTQARAAAPAVIFIDEIDAVGRKRSMKAMGNEERDQTLNQLLVEMDGFHTSHAVVVLAATNRVDILDKALLRPGRFDRHISVSLPDRAGRRAILGLHTARTPLQEEVSLERLARLTTGMSGADLANLVNEAALCAARKDLEKLDQVCFEQALSRVQLGALRPLVMTESERRVIAYHEGGHALVAYHLPEADLVNAVTILPRGESLGVTQFVAEEDRYNYSRQMLMAKIAVGLGGRVAEELMLGREQVTTGAENDFQVVTTMARRMVTCWGMSEEVGVIFAGSNESGAGLNLSRLEPSSLPSRTQTLALDVNGRLVANGQPRVISQSMLAMSAPAASPLSSSGMSALVDQEIRKILEEGQHMAQRILQEHVHQLHRLADALVEREQLNRTEFEALLKA
jgi:cell division protease FtsH